MLSRLRTWANRQDGDPSSRTVITSPSRLFWASKRRSWVSVITSLKSTPAALQSLKRHEIHERYEKKLFTQLQGLNWFSCSSLLHSFASVTQKSLKVSESSCQGAMALKMVMALPLKPKSFTKRTSQAWCDLNLGNRAAQSLDEMHRLARPPTWHTQITPLITVLKELS